MRGQEHWNTPVRLFMHKKMQCLKLQSVPKKGCRGHPDNHKLSIFTRETVHSPLLFISQRRWYGDLPSDPPQNKETKANRDQRAQAGNIETPKVEAKPSSPKEAPSRNQEAHSKAASPLNEESNASPAGNSHPLFNAYYSARFGKRPTNRMEAEKTKLHTVAPRDGICGKDYSHTSWSALEMLSLAIPSTVVVLAGYWMWRRWFGSDRIEDCTELESMHYLLDSSNPVDYVFIDPEYQVATVYVPVDTLSPDPVATEGDESTEPVRVRKGSFSFHVSDIARLDDTLATLCTPPRRVTYKSGIDLPWHAFIFAALIIPPLILLRFRIIVARGIQSTVPGATRNTSSVGTTNGGNEHPSNRTRPINFRASQPSSGTPGIPGSRSDSGHFKIERGKTQTRFRDIAGMTEPKNEVREVVDFLVSPEKYHRLGATVPKGVLLSGVPGVGKTMLARAVAGEADVKFIYCSGSEFVEIFVGVGAARIRELFRTAHENAPCVIFIDEIDSFAKSRRMGSKQSSEGDSTINALLSEMDGFHPTSGVVVMAGTNRIDVLDDALLRPGRFDRKITIDAPPYADRVDIFALHLNKLKLAVHKADSASLVGALARQLASLTPGCSGADIKNICNEAAIIAAREGRDHVHSVCLQQGLDRVQLGLLRMSAVMSQEDRERAAYHEAGHVVVNWNLERCDPMQKVTILPYSGNKASIHRRLPQERFIRTKEELEERMCDCLGGVAAEELVYAGEMSSASADDLSKATRLGRQMVTVYGMCPEVLGHFSFPDTENAIHKPYSTDTEQEIDEQVSRLVAKARERARTLVRENEVYVRALQGLLLKQETLTAKDIALVLGPKKGMSQEFSRILAA